jgi:predicted nucleic acid-binding protein
VNAFSSEENGSDESMSFLSQLGKERVPLIQPTLFLPEVAASIARKQDDTDAALELERELKNFLDITLVDLDEDIADFASEIAAKHRLRGSDAVYAAVALRFGTELITLDKEQLERLPKVLVVRKPE